MPADALVVQPGQDAAPSWRRSAFESRQGAVWEISYPTSHIFLSHDVHRHLMRRTKLDDKGRVSIPASLRRELGLGPEDEVIVERDGARLVLKKAAPEVLTVDSRGGWRRKPVLTAREAVGGP